MERRRLERGGLSAGLDGVGIRAFPPVRRGSIGIMGGTFDPIHLGHLAVAEEAREALGLERILFVPAGIPPHKPAGAVASVEDRVAMVGLAIAGNDRFELSRIEVDRDGPSFTVDTVEALVAEIRTAGREPDLTLIVSAETFRDLPTWRQPERLIASARIAVAPREGYPAPDAMRLSEIVPGAADRVDLLDGPRLDVSSTDIRARVAAGRSIRYLVPDSVADHIARHALYIDRRTPRP